MADMMIPAFLQNQSFEEILNEMIGMLPADIDTSEGSHPYNLLAPTAYEKARMVEFVMVEAIKLIFPQYCVEYDEIVDHHAQMCGMTRKVAEKATGEITVTGDPGAVIEAGSKFSTVTINGVAGVEFETTEKATIGEDGAANIPIQAVEAGKSGNVSARTIILMSSTISGVNSVINNDSTSGGLEAETTAALVERIMDYEAAQGESFVGNPGDYKRWALEVQGTGGAQVIGAQDNSGLVTIVLTNANGEPAITGDELCQAVYNHIMRPDNPAEKLAPCGARLEVVGPVTITINVMATVMIDNDLTTLDTVKTAFCEALKNYLISAANDGMIVYTKVGSLLSQVRGVEDYANLKINGSAENIAIMAGLIPRMSDTDVTLTEA